jgi:hypothetical protein
MRLGIVRMGMAVWLAGCVCQSVCQTDPPADDSLYSALFQRLALQARSILLNGQPVTLPQPAIQEAAGLTDQEMKDLNRIAADCQTSVRAVERRPHAVFDALMESIETGKDTTAEVQQLAKEEESQRQRIVLDHIQQLRTALGDARFQALTAWLRAEEAPRPRVMKRQ